MLTSFLLFIILILLLFFTSQTLIKSLLKLTGPNFVFFLLLPGIFLHEFSHLFMATLLRVPTGHLSLKPQLKNNHLKLGSAQIGQTDPFRLTLIGTAPFIFASLTLYFLLRLGLNLNPVDLNLQALSLSQSTPPLLIILICYFLFAIANTMFSSPSDLQAAGVPFVLLLILFISLELSRTPIPLSVISSLTNLLNLLSGLFFIVLLLNLLILLPLKLIFKNMLH